MSAYLRFLKKLWALPYYITTLPICVSVGFTLLYHHPAYVCICGFYSTVSPPCLCVYLWVLLYCITTMPMCVSVGFTLLYHHPAYVCICGFYSTVSPSCLCVYLWVLLYCISTLPMCVSVGFTLLYHYTLYVKYVWALIIRNVGNSLLLDKV
jgi:hypothetical protein